jgi:uncharacterized small protein (DUF1192 family)
MFDLRMLVPIFGILLVMIPVTGLTVALVAKTLAKIRRDAEPAGDVDGLAARVALLQDEVEALTHEVKELKAAQDFDRKLLGKDAAR